MTSSKSLKPHYVSNFDHFSVGTHAIPRTETLSIYAYLKNFTLLWRKLYVQSSQKYEFFKLIKNVRWVKMKKFSLTDKPMLHFHSSGCKIYMSVWLLTYYTNASAIIQCQVMQKRSMWIKHNAFIYYWFLMLLWH